MNTPKNSVQLIGNLGGDPELKTFDSGRNLVNFTMATNESFRKADGEFSEETQWHKIVAWGKTAEYIHKNFKKGQQVLIHGKLQYRNYEDKEGIKRYQTEIVAQNCLKLFKEPVTA